MYEAAMQQPQFSTLCNLIREFRKVLGGITKPIMIQMGTTAKRGMSAFFPLLQVFWCIKLSLNAARCPFTKGGISSQILL